VRWLIGGLCAWLLGAAGWWLGGKFNLAAAILLSVITGSVGLYLGNRWFDQNLK
jgi:hypothetical protein